MQRTDGNKRGRRGQALIDYLVVMMIVMTLALIVLGLSISLPDMGQSIQSRGQLSYWQDQARPFAVTNAFYRINNSRIYISFEVKEDETFNLTGLFVNNTQLSFYNYDPASGDGVGANPCSSEACHSTPCTCDYPMRPLAPGRIVTEPFKYALAVCGPGQTLSPMSVQLVYFRPNDPTRNLTEEGSVMLPFSCQ